MAQGYLNTKRVLYPVMLPK